LVVPTCSCRSFSPVREKDDGWFRTDDLGRPRYFPARHRSSVISNSPARPGGIEPRFRGFGGHVATLARTYVSTNSVLLQWWIHWPGVSGMGGKFDYRSCRHKRHPVGGHVCSESACDPPTWLWKPMTLSP